MLFFKVAVVTKIGRFLLLSEIAENDVFIGSLVHLFSGRVGIHLPFADTSTAGRGQRERESGAG